jgi:hypothetical protein
MPLMRRIDKGGRGGRGSRKRGQGKSALFENGKWANEYCQERTTTRHSPATPPSLSTGRCRARLAWPRVWGVRRGGLPPEQCFSHFEEARANTQPSLNLPPHHPAQDPASLSVFPPL